MTMRIAMYWHNGRSLGHTAESAKIAHALARDFENVSLAGVAGAYRGLDMLPSALDLIKLPSFANFDRPTGWDLTGRQGLDGNALFRARAELAEVFLRHYAPDVLLVNHLPRGLEDELVPALAGKRCGVRILTLRGVLFDRDKTNRLYFAGDAGQWIIDHFDAIFVHTDPSIFKLEDAYDVPDELKARIHYLGYLIEPTVEDRGTVRQRLGIALDSRLVVATMGGGQGAMPIWHRVIEALDASRDRFDTGYLVSGPYLEPEASAELARLVGDRPWLTLASYEPALPDFMAAADLVIAAAGSNMLGEILAAKTNAIVIPRQVRESEQRIHAGLLQDRELVRMCTLEDIDAGALVSKVASALDAPLDPRPDLAFGGTRRYAAEILRVLTEAGFTTGAAALTEVGDD